MNFTASTVRTPFSRRAALGTVFFGVCGSLFAVSVGVTIARCVSMSAMGEVPMPGGWMMSMAWLPMCGQTWPGVAMTFLGMWVVMMMAMMLPSLVPVLWRYRQAVGGAGERRIALLIVLAGAGYFIVWTVVGMLVFPLGAALASAEMHMQGLARVVPMEGGGVVMISGALQFTAWKARHLGRCRESIRCGRACPADAGSALRHGLHFGFHCVYSCVGLTAILLVVGVMDLAAMAIVTAAITAERLAPDGGRVARVIGGVAVAAGWFMIARAAGFG